MSTDQTAIRPYLTTISLDPENQGTPIHFSNDWITPERLFFLRNHYPYPPITPESFKLAFSGVVRKPGFFFTMNSYCRCLPKQSFYL